MGGRDDIHFYVARPSLGGSTPSTVSTFPLYAEDAATNLQRSISTGSCRDEESWGAIKIRASKRVFIIYLDQSSGPLGPGNSAGGKTRSRPHAKNLQATGGVDSRFGPDSIAALPLHERRRIFSQRGRKSQLYKHP